MQGCKLDEWGRLGMKIVLIFFFFGGGGSFFIY